MADGAQKLATFLQPLLKALGDELKEYISAQNQEVLIAVKSLEVRMDILEKLVSEKRKPVSRAKADKTADAGDAKGDAAEGEAVKQPTGAAKNFAVNKLVYFRGQFKTDEAYRTKYVTPELQGMMDADDTIKKKKTPEQKLVAQATFCWNYYKAAVPPTVANEIEADYKAKKAANEAANKPPQEAAEPNTPPAEVAEVTK
jgi:hypothetical protein